MKKLLLFAGFLTCLPAFADPCVSGTLQSYINLGATGCSDGSAVFRNFMTVPGQNGATQVAAGAVSVTPGGTLTNPNLTFGLNLTATNSQLFESIFRFNVLGTFSGVTDQLNSPTATGNGLVLSVVDICPGGSFSGTSPSGCPAGATTLIAAFDTVAPLLLDSATFPARSAFDVFTDLTADGGGTGTARLQSATVGFTGGISAVPEPASLTFMLGGLSLIGLFARRKSQKAPTEEQ